MMKDVVVLDMVVAEAFIEKTGLKALSRNTFLKGLSELVSNKIIARHNRQGWYFINPNFIFNGDRVAFSNIDSKSTANERYKDFGYV